MRGHGPRSGVMVREESPFTTTQPARGLRLWRAALPPSSGMLLLRAHPSAPDLVLGEFRSVAEPELLEDVHSMTLDRLLAD